MVTEKKRLAGGKERKIKKEKHVHGKRLFFFFFFFFLQKVLRKRGTKKMWEVRKESRGRYRVGGDAQIDIA